MQDCRIEALTLCRTGGQTRGIQVWQVAPRASTRFSGVFRLPCGSVVSGPLDLYHCRAQPVWEAARLLPFCRSTGVAVMSAFFPRNCTPHVAPLGSHTAMLGDQPVLIPGDKLSLESVVGGSRFLSSTEAILHFFPCSPTVWTGRTPTVLAAGLRRSWTNVSNAFSTNVPIGAPPVACRGNGLVHP